MRKRKIASKYGDQDANYAWRVSTIAKIVWGLMLVPPKDDLSEAMASSY
jgi:hypothetical protein